MPSWQEPNFPHHNNHKLFSPATKIYTNPSNNYLGKVGHCREKTGSVALSDYAFIEAEHSAKRMFSTWHICGNMPLGRKDLPSINQQFGEFKLDIAQLLETAQTQGLPYLIMAGKALAIFIIGRIVVKILCRIADKLMIRSELDPMLRNFLRNMLYAVLLTFVVIAAIGALGIQTASLVAILGAAGLAVGLALQGSLSNFAAGVLMIIFRPYKLGDMVNVAGTTGVVEEVEIFTTVLRTPDKTKIIIPNGQVMAEQIINYTDVKNRRVDMVVGISYNDDIDKAREVILAALPSNEYVLDDPAPKVSVAGLGDSSVDLAVRPWVDATKYPAASHAINETIKKALDAANIEMPYPQSDVHIYKHDENPG